MHRQSAAIEKLDPIPPIPYRPASLAGLLAVDDIELNIAIPAVS
jgi:hypothetical protein